MLWFIFRWIRSLKLTQHLQIEIADFPFKLASFQVLAILISNRRTAISWGFLGSSCNQLITQHRFNKLPTNENPPTNSLLAVVNAGFVGFVQGKKNTQIKIQYDKTTMCPFIQVPKFPTYWQRKLPKEKTLESPCFPRGYRIVMESTSI